MYFTFNLNNLFNDPFFLAVIISSHLQKIYAQNKWLFINIDSATSNMYDQFNMYSNKCFLCLFQFYN